jgi:hypothetical protein
MLPGVAVPLSRGLPGRRHGCRRMFGRIFYSSESHPWRLPGIRAGFVPAPKNQHDRQV